MPACACAQALMMIMHIASYIIIKHEIDSEYQ